jgi:hypothetical protein
MSGAGWQVCLTNAAFVGGRLPAGLPESCLSAVHNNGCAYAEARWNFSADEDGEACLSEKLQYLKNKQRHPAHKLLEQPPHAEFETQIANCSGSCVRRKSSRDGACAQSLDPSMLDLSYISYGLRFEGGACAHTPPPPAASPAKPAKSKANSKQMWRGAGCGVRGAGCGVGVKLRIIFIKLRSLKRIHRHQLLRSKSLRKCVTAKLHISSCCDVALSHTRCS